MHHPERRGALLRLALVGCGRRCSGSDTTSVLSPPEATASASPAPTPLYGVFTSVETDEEETTYLGLTPTLAEDAALDRSTALEAPPSSRFYAPRTGGFFAIGSNDDFSITRYELAGTEPPQLVEKGRLSFAGLGVTRLQNRVVFVSESKAYYIDETGAQLVIWNPRDMLIERTVALPPALGDGYQGYATDLPFGRYPLVQGLLFIPAAWYDFERGTARPLTGLAVIDTEVDSVLSYSETARCAGATELAFDDNGDVYYGTGVNYPFYAHAADAALRTRQRPGCILRIRAGEQAFDPDYLLRMSDVTGGATSMGLTDAASAGSAYVQAIDENVLPWAEVSDEDAFWEGSSWSWWKIDLRSGEAELDAEIPASAPYMTSYEVDGRRFVSRQAGDSASRLYQLSPTGDHLPGFSSVGEIRGVARIR